MEKLAKYKPKNKKPAPKPKTTKKRKQSDGPTCSMFLAEITRKLAARRRQGEEETPRNIVQTIIDSLTNALPVIFSRRTSEQTDSGPSENVQDLAPELLPKDTLDIPCPVAEESSTEIMQEISTAPDKIGFKMPKMPLINSEVIKIAIEKRRKVTMQDASTDTTDDHDMASELVKHVSTLRRISLIAEEFNQKTAKNLKEIVDSVQEDLLKKLEEIQAEQRATAAAIVAQSMEAKQFEEGHSEDDANNEKNKKNE